MGKKNKKTTLSKKEQKKEKWRLNNIREYWIRVSGIEFEGDPNSEEDVETYAAMCKDIVIQKQQKRKKAYQYKQKQENTENIEHESMKEDVQNIEESEVDVNEENIE